MRYESGEGASVPGSSRFQDLATISLLLAELSREGAGQARLMSGIPTRYPNSNASQGVPKSQLGSKFIPERARPLINLSHQIMARNVRCR
jgi:hypothetical protein